MKIALFAALIAAGPALADDAIYHPNGQRAWDGSSMGNVYHANGVKAWNGMRLGNVYHASGTQAWNGMRLGNVYHSNGELAWNGMAGGALYGPEGQVLCSSSSGVDLPLGDGITLHVRVAPRYSAWLTVVCRDLVMDEEPGEPDGCRCACECCRTRSCCR